MSDNTHRKTLQDVYRFDGDKDKVKAAVLKNRSIEVLPDFSSSFGNFVWFSSAKEIVDCATNRIIDDYPWDGDWQTYYDFQSSASLFENYWEKVFPRYVGDFLASGSYHASGSDNSGRMHPGTGSMSIEFWLKSEVKDANKFIFGKGKTNYFYSVFTSGSGADSNVAFYAKSAAVDVCLSQVLPLNEWIYCGITIDRANDIVSIFTGSQTKSPVCAISASYGLGNMFCGDTLFGICNSSYCGEMGWGVPAKTHIDELRVWNKSLGIDQLKAYFSCDTRAQYGLVGYWKFNEPPNYNEATLRKLMDYSGWKNHAWVNLSGSVMRVSGTALYHEEGTPLQYADYAPIVAFTSSWIDRAESYDTYNQALITKNLPSKFIELDENNDRVLVNFLYAYAKHLDECRLYIGQLKNLYNISYDKYNRTPDQLLIHVAKNLGIEIKDPFEGYSVFERIFGQDIIGSGSIGDVLMQVRNMILLRAVNTIPYLVKTKGRADVFRTILNIYGIDSDVIKLREFGYDKESGITDTYSGDRERMPYITIFD